MKLKISPSILSADLANLEQEVARMLRAGADMVHFDVMDGLFVPNISFGIPVLQSLNQVCSAMMDVHLMIQNPYAYLDDFIDAGADLLTCHIESESDPAACIEKIHSRGKLAALSLNPETPLSAVEPYLSSLDMLLVMTVRPGFGGQSFMAEQLDKVRAVRRMYPKLDIQVDGGINAQTAPLVQQAGANVLVAGSYLFHAKDPLQAMAALRG